MSYKIPRTLGFFDSLCFVIGMVVGVGIYQTPALIASSVSSVFELLLAWCVGGILTAAGALCYMVLTARYPEEGGDYNFFYRIFGPLAAFMYAWAQVFLVRPGALAAIAFPFSTYVKAGYQDAFGEVSEVCIALIAVTVFSFLNFVATSIGVLSQRILSIASYILLLAIAFWGLRSFSNLEATIFEVNNGSNSDFGFALVLVLFTFGGWSDLAILAGEIKRPRKIFARSLTAGLLAVALLYGVVNLAFCNHLSFEGLQKSIAPAVDMFPFFDGKIVSLVVCLCCLSSLNGAIISGSRISYVFGKDFSNFLRLNSWNDKSNCPKRALVFQWLLSMLFITLAGSFKIALVYTTTIVWLFYLGIGIGTLKLLLRSADVNLEINKTSKLFCLISAIVFSLSCIYLIRAALLFDFTGSLVTTLFALLGAPVYFCFFYNKSERIKISQV